MDRISRGEIPVEDMAGKIRKGQRAKGIRNKEQGTWNSRSAIYLNQGVWIGL